MSKLSDNCCLCHVNMLRKRTVQLSPCLHFLHENCWAQASVNGTRCPLCRDEVEDSTLYERHTYKVHGLRERQLIVEAANRGDDWVTLASSLEVRYKTAYSWIRSGEVEGKSRGGNKPTVLTDEMKSMIIREVEDDPTITIKKLQSLITSGHHLLVSTMTISNFLNGQLYTIKKLYHQPQNMNTSENKAKRKMYIQQLNAYIQDGRQIMFTDETNFNLFIRRSNGRSKVGTRAVCTLPASRGPNLHLIGAITNNGIVKMTTNRGSFTWQKANEWFTQLLEFWVESGHVLSELVVVADNAPCHNRLHLVFEASEAKLLKLGPYSPMLNAIETIWSKIKASVKANISIPQVLGRNAQEQRLAYLETLVTSSINCVTAGDCSRAIQHTTTFYEDALNLREMRVGQ